MDAGVPYNVVGGQSYQYAKTGNAYIFLDYTNLLGSNERAYMQIKLKDTLRKDKLYYCEYYVNSPNSQTLACNNIAMLFTDTPRYSDPNRLGNAVINANPQILNYGNPIMGDTLNWLKVSGILKAKGGEWYLTLGNFKNDANTQTKQIVATGYAAAGYYIDDVSVLPLDSFCLQANAGRDTTIKLGDSVFIGSYTNGIDTIKWFNGSGQVIDSTRPGFWVKPTTIGTYMYVVQQTVNGCFSSDTVWVNVQALPLKIIDYKLLIINGHTPNPSQEGNVENLWATANEINVSHYNIERSTNAKDFTVIGKQKAHNQPTNNYTFTDPLTTSHLPLTLYYRVVGVDLDGRKTYSSVRSITTSHSPLAINIYPNPAKDVVNVESKEAIKEVKLFNMFGREIATGTNLRNDGNNANHLSLNINHYPKGLYMVQVRLVNGSVVNEKLVVE